MFPHQQHHIKPYMNAVDESFRIIVKAEQDGDLGNEPHGDATCSGFKRLT